ncbi:hypothetical protein J1N35_018963 [Gossypium stocksii]|uniref:Uncharacterized protein n=1 Tax=Gossypium stocksii TaxID=47602 RepID=A0A9D4A7P1_9ROSI|nr:hypothetical protein J1N35_018963 [Gossypium stocksii]
MSFGSYGINLYSSLLLRQRMDQMWNQNRNSRNKVEEQGSEVAVVRKLAKNVLAANQGEDHRFSVDTVVQMFKEPNQNSEFCDQ